MNQITDLRADLAVAEQDLAAHQDKYYFLKGWGTGWEASHYGLSVEEYNAAYAHNTVLRGRVLAILHDIKRRAKPGRMHGSMVAHHV